MFAMVSAERAHSSYYLFSQKNAAQQEGEAMKGFSTDHHSEDVGAGVIVAHLLKSAGICSCHWGQPFESKHYS